MILRKIITISLFCLICLGIFAAHSTFAQTTETIAPKQIEVNFFYSKTCPHCLAEQKFLDKMEIKYPQIEINRYLATDPENQALLKSLCEKCKAERYLGLVPLTFIEGEFFLGFNNENGIGKQIEDTIIKHLENINNNDSGITLPFIGKIDASKYSLLTLTIILGFLDGFNVCSLGALVMILGLVLAFRSRRRTLIFGSTFLVTTALIYGLLMFLWYKLFSYFSGYMQIMHIIVALIALIGGVYFFKDFLKFRKQGATCDTNGNSKTVSRLTAKLSDTFENKNNILILIMGILVFAALITVIEFPCSAAVPVVYTGILANSGTNLFQDIIYLAIYLILYLFDEIIVFLVAFFTMKLWLTSQKFVTWITFAEAIILVFLGIYYLIGI